MPEAKHVAVLMGGWSAERPVSLASGKACAEALESAGYRVTTIDVGRDIAARLAAIQPDVAFNALHGPDGEGGTIQGLLEIMRIPYTHSGVLSSVLALHKPRAKTVMAAAGVPVTEHKLVTRAEAAHKHPIKPPYVVKPVSEGSSFGVLIVNENAAYPPQELYRDDWPYGDDLMAERYIPGRELTCAVMGDVALDVIEILPLGDSFYDYDAKYREGGSKHVLPAEISPIIYQSIQSLTLKAHQALGLPRRDKGGFSLRRHR